MPPCYEDLNGVQVNDNNGNVNGDNGNVNGDNSNVSGDNGNVNSGNGNVNGLNVAGNAGVNEPNGVGNVNGDAANGNCELTEENRLNIATNVFDNKSNDMTQNDDSHVETLSSIIDNLPAIDSDVNANDTEIPVNRVNQILFIRGGAGNRSLAGHNENVNVAVINNNVIVNNE